MENSSQSKDINEPLEKISASYSKFQKNLDWAMVDEDSNESYDAENESSDLSDQEKDMTYQKYNSGDTKAHSGSLNDTKKSEDNLSEDKEIQQQTRKVSESQIQQISPEKIAQQEIIKPIKRPPIPLGQSVRQQQKYGASKEGMKYSGKQKSRQENIIVNKSQYSDNISGRTNPNSIYRKYYNRSTEFFIWVINHEEPPYIFKLHIQALSPNEISIPMLKRSIEKEIHQDAKYQIEIRHFPKKCQFKVFLEFHDKQQSAEFFLKFYAIPHLQILGQNDEKLFSRTMRAYLIKDEGTFERLALQKYQEDGKNSDGGSIEGGTPNSSLGSKKHRRGKKKSGSFNNSSDEGSGQFSLSRGRGRKVMNQSRGSVQLPKTQHSSFEQEENKQPGSQRETIQLQNKPPLIKPFYKPKKQLSQTEQELSLVKNQLSTSIEGQDQNSQQNNLSQGHSNERRSLKYWILENEPYDDDEIKQTNSELIPSINSTTKPPKSPNMIQQKIVKQRDERVPYTTDQQEQQRVIFIKKTNSQYEERQVKDLQQQRTVSDISQEQTKQNRTIINSNKEEIKVEQIPQQTNEFQQKRKEKTNLKTPRGPNQSNKYQGYYK